MFDHQFIASIWIFQGLFISERTIHRHLRLLNLRRHNVRDNDDLVLSAIQREINERGNYRGNTLFRLTYISIYLRWNTGHFINVLLIFQGYRQITAAVRNCHDVSCTRGQVAELLRSVDPEASACRRGNKLVSHLFNH